MPKHAIMVSMTHWDREHARPIEQFRWHLVYNVLDQVIALLDDGTLPYFILDGQTLPLEDYLAIRPEREADLKRLVSAGQLVVGPFFTTPDEMIPGGEALIRNLLLGQRIAAKFGATDKVANNIDAFGHPAQMPQLLRGFGIGRAAYARGLGAEVPGWGAPFRWQGPDGSEVLGINHGIQNLIGLPDKMEDAVAAVKNAIAAFDPYDLPVILLGNGGDGAPPRPRLPEVVAAFNASSDDAQVSIGTLDEYFTALEALDQSVFPLIPGELCATRFNIMLQGVPSARTYLKQANFVSERALARYAEPLATAAWLFTDDPYPAEFLERAWRADLENLFHDTICGCSGDLVYHDAMNRYEHATQIAQILVERAVKRLGAKLNTVPPVPDAAPILAFNPHAYPLDEPVRARLFLPAESDVSLAYTVLDGAGNAVPAQVTGQRVVPTYQPHFWRKFLPYDKQVRELDIAFAPTLPSLGSAVFFVGEGDVPPVEKPVVVTEKGLENEFLRVDIRADGLLTLTDKRTGKVYTGLNRFEDEESLCGEYYHVSFPTPDVRCPPPPKSVTVSQAGPLLGTVALEYDWLLPVGATEDLKGRSAETALCPMRVEVALWAGVPRVEITVQFDNRVRDHRLRTVFPTDLQTDCLAAETPFAVVQRPVDLPETEGWCEPLCAESAQQSFSDLSDGKVGLAVLNQGLAEIGVHRTEGGVAMGLTLLRAVGWIARLHWGVAGYRIPTPEAQCSGAHTFKYALYPHAGDWQEGRVWEQAQRFAVPAIVHDVDASEGEGNAVPLLDISPAELVISACKRADDADAVIVRLWNAASHEVNGVVRLGFAATEACRVNLNEEAGETLEVKDGTVELAVRAHEIVTIQVKRAG